VTETVSRTVSSKPPSNGTLNESMVSFSAVTADRLLADDGLVNVPGF